MRAVCNTTTHRSSGSSAAGSNEARTAANNARSIDEWNYDRGPNNFDVRHTFNLSAIYNLPSVAANAIFGNREVGMILNARLIRKIRP
jgi:hypothetical protein